MCNEDFVQLGRNFLLDHLCRYAFYKNKIK
jgi:hypothetical protein